MAERWSVIKLEIVAGAPSFRSEQEALGEAAMRSKRDDEMFAVVQVVAEVRRDPDPPAVVTRFE